MSRRDYAWFLTMALLTALVAATAPAFPATQVGNAPEPLAEETQPIPKETAVEEILRQQDASLRGQRGYDPSGRRDPFQSLFEIVRLQDEAQRPPGIEGMLIGEVNLDGIVRNDATGDVAFFMGSDNKGYFLKVGQSVYDGTLIAIDSQRGTVTFRQKVDDPRLIKPYRDVVLRLVPLDEESTHE